MIIDSIGMIVDHVVTLTLSHCVVIKDLVLDQFTLSKLSVYDTIPDVFLVPKVTNRLVLELSGILLMCSTFLEKWGGNEASVSKVYHNAVATQFPSTTYAAMVF